MSVISVVNNNSNVEEMNRELSLSNTDKAVLNVIFNPHLPYSACSDDIDTAGHDGHDSATLESHDEVADDEAVGRAVQLELDGVKAAESGDLQAAIQLLTLAIQLVPTRASGYNNRAQALQLLKDIDGAMQDLDEALRLSQGRGKVACQAYTQRGILYRLQGNNGLALSDFQNAARLGSQFAQSQVIALNPYAALCSNVIGEILQKACGGYE